jgi:soluble lytic murein transglycosylase
MSMTEWSWAEASVPVPAKKPAIEIKGEIVEYSFKDFTKALLSGEPTQTADIKNDSGTKGPLSEYNARHYKNIFALQAAGKMDEAREDMKALTDDRLRGHVLYQRYMHPKYKTSFNELKDWMAAYADLPGADKIYRMANSRKPADFSGKVREPQFVKMIVAGRDPAMPAAKSYKSAKSRSGDEHNAVRALQNQIFSMLKEKHPGAAHKKLDGSKTVKLLDSVEYDLLRAQIASGYLHSGDNKEAYALAAASVKRSGLHVPLAGWVAGMTAWQNKEYKAAARFFEIPARSPYASGWTSAAGSFWAARAHARSGSAKNADIWLARAAEYPRTFYGLIATRTLGRDFDFDWKVPTYTASYRDLLEQSPAGNRAIALVAAGQMHLAEGELMRVNTGKTSEMRNALLSYAGFAGLPGLSMRLANAEGKFYDAALYPTNPWKPKDGYKVDPALIHAIMRQESRFDAGAKSSAGAKGLMQIMPATATYISGSEEEGAHVLMDPESNLELGQQYITELLRDRYVKGDIFSLLVAYNAGPGNLARWKKEWADVEDPLLFIELIPSSETRSYVERVLANYWIYRLREDQSTPSLDALAKGKDPRYADAKILTIDKSYRIALSQ